MDGLTTNSSQEHNPATVKQTAPGEKTTAAQDPAKAESGSTAPAVAALTPEIVANPPVSAPHMTAKPHGIYDTETDRALNRPQFDRSDAVMSLIVFVLGWLFARWVFFSWTGWGVSVFTAAYLTAGMVYLRVRRGSVNRSSWFWFAAAMAIGLTYAFWDNAGFAPLRSVALFMCAVYWVVEAAGFRIADGSFFPLDCVNALFVVPFCGFIYQYRALGGFRRAGKRGHRRAPVLIGALLALLLFFIVIPPLLQADGGVFNVIFGSMTDFFYSALFDFKLVEILIYLPPAIPVAAYMYGLLSCAAHDWHTRYMRADEIRGNITLRFLPHTAVTIALTALAGLYVLFILCQIPYFFSALTHRLPEGWRTYSDYARQGFFELVRIAVTNIAVMLAANFLSKTPTRDSKQLRILNAAISAITLLLLLTAFSKMMLYVSEYGLTMKRLLPCVFMVFLAITFLAVIVAQKRRFDVARFSVLTGVVIFTVLCAANPDAIVTRYNAARYLAGTLSSFDVEIARRAGVAGILPAIDVFEQTDDEKLRRELSWTIRRMVESTSGELSYAENHTGHRGNYEAHIAESAATQYRGTYESVADVRVSPGGDMYYGGKLFRQYMILPESAANLRGALIAVVNGNNADLMYELVGFSADEWLIREVFDMNPDGNVTLSLYKAAGVEGVPDEIQNLAVR